ncbi:DsbA family protein [Pararobbsia silviterrae]|uniref:DsbA family protein n=1 Tax=Pararobbsia silviterrae TaxID=1792498 RepID=A0A494XSW6_9BURK|nr:DsbA family protein [Pararobbsia silviterrae]RKP53687.1 DsbA family protein [Pararobbsia silviterrae]
MTTLHYIFDPLCGWCYAAAPLVEAARAVPDLKVVFHGGGMMTGPNRRTITPQWRDYVMPHDHRISELTGQPFGDAYFDGLLRDVTAVLDSEPPLTAILAAEALDARGLDMIHAVQRAHYVDGRRIADADVLRDIAARIGLDGDAFDAQCTRLGGTATLEHIRDARALLERVGGNGFPTFAIEDAQGRFGRIDTGTWLGRPTQWAQALAQAVTSDAV